jgi:hypothetical protein
MPDKVRCSGCGRFRPSQVAASSERQACPHCGGAALTFGLSAHLTAEATVTIRSSLRPGDQRQGWERRWQDIQDEAAVLLAPLTVERSSGTILAARRLVQSFYGLSPQGRPQARLIDNRHRPQRSRGHGDRQSGPRALV